MLGIPSTATDEEVKKAYRNLARKIPPTTTTDNPLEDLAQERMKEINEAYETIRSPAQGRPVRRGSERLRLRLQSRLRAGYNTGYNTGSD